MSAPALADEVLAFLRARQPHRASTLLLVAHPDDEVLGASVVLRFLPCLRLCHATDGSGGDAAVTAARMTELLDGLAVLGVAPTLAPCGYPDGALIGYARPLAAALAAWLPGTQLIVTHAFEGGHPDHDACALSAALACAAERDRSGRRVPRLEFAIYARSGGTVVTNAFAAEDATLRLTREEQAQKAVALRAFASQRHVVERFPLAAEAIRAAPDHNFGHPRDPESLLFAHAAPRLEERWRAGARAALAG